MSVESLQIKGLRLLGNCPNCRSEDTLTQIDGLNPYKDPISCCVCSESWPSWRDLVITEGKRENRLIPVWVHRLVFNDKEFGVQVEYPLSRQEIPEQTMVTSMLNSALIARFPNLDVSFSTEGGIEGSHRREWMELRNCGDHLGLYTEDGYWQGRGVREVLDFYEKMLRSLFMEGFKIRKTYHRPGEILRLKPEDQNPGEIWKIMQDILMHVGGRRFSRKNISTMMGIGNNPFSRPYLSGLTDKEIVGLFVPPPFL